MCRGRLAWFLVAIAACAAAQPQPAPSAAAVSAPRFEITRYRVEGNTLLPLSAIEARLARFTGPDRDFGDVQRALESLQAMYQEEGYGAVEIRLPEQELEKGEVRLLVLETKIGSIAVEGNTHFTAENIRRSVPSLREGTTPNSRKIAESIRLANENPAKQSTVLLKGGSREEVVDATIRVTDIKPERWSISLDNTGNQNTGRARMGVAYQHANLFDRDHVLTAQYITSPTQIEDVTVLGIGYRIPIYSQGDSLEFVAGYSNVDSGTVQDIFVVSGQGTVFGVRYNQALPRWRELEHKVTYGLDYRAYQNQVTPEVSQDNLVPDITLHPASVTYSGAVRDTGRDFSFYLSMAQNIPGGNDGVDEDFKKLGARPGVGTQGYRVFRGGVNLVQAFPKDWQTRINFSAQYTEDALVAPEQFGIGGADSIRGFNERYASNDKGYRTTVEFYTPDVAKPVGLDQARLRFLLFYDSGKLYRNQPLAFEREAASLDSAGLGVRFGLGSALSARLDIAHVLHDGSGYNEPDSRRNIKKVHFSVAWVW